MNNKALTIDDFEPAILLGSNNKHLKTLQNHFPMLKIVHRGNQLLLSGENFSLEVFEEKFLELCELIQRYGSLTELQLEAVLAGIAPKKEAKTEEGSPLPETGDIILYGTNGKVIRAKSPNQKKMVSLLRQNDILFAIGPAGTGKTYTAVALAVKALKEKEIKRIILARPAVEAGENLGFLPGDLKEKIDPYLRPLYDALDDMIPADKLKTYIETRVIEIAPMAFMRGRTLDNAYVILDEAQNATDLQLKMFLTRMGPNAKFIITGDLTQVDLPRQEHSGLPKALKILEGIKGIDIAWLSFEDVVRHRLVKDIIKAYDHKPESKTSKQA